jgi:hypothetical protein
VNEQQALQGGRWYIVVIRETVGTTVVEGTPHNQKISSKINMVYRVRVRVAGAAGCGRRGRVRVAGAAAGAAREATAVRAQAAAGPRGGRRRRACAVQRRVERAERLRALRGPVRCGGGSGWCTA